MSHHPQIAAAANADQRLSQLIKLKQLEKPEAAYWEKFEQDFRSKQLTTFVQIQPMHTRLRRACMILARKAAPPVAAAGAVALTFFAVTNTRYLAKGTDTEAPATIPTLSQREAASEPEAYFIVSATQDTDTESKNTTSDTIYQINALSSLGGSTDGYLLNATPVTFSQSSATASGANVIGKQPNY